ncbi:PAS domain-containing protein [uncultured Desulfosarcina sp.]|uniref:PAS domain-containing protein n=1 Tax=uncultured Desulfosarcina sp. TaxID=218289 RepID=UPI0029C67D4C|nr:PAS domain-containing protein [uncultured Desulfosarcina sp.]
MGIVLWLLILLLLSLGAWGFHQYRHQELKMQTLKHSLLEINQKTHAKEEAHTKNQAQWEQTEEKLRSFLLLMDTVMNTIPNPIYFKDAEGVYQGCNKVFAKKILGLTRDRIIGKRPMEMPDQIPADLAAAYQREEYKMIDKAGFHAFETQVQCADGQRRDYLFSLAPVMDRQGKLSGSVAVLSDLTEKNHAARHRLQKEKLEGILEIAGAVCHEFNQPLQAISGYTELMAMKLDGHEAHSYIDKLTDQIDRMRDITDKLQGVTRYETKEYAGNTKIIDIKKASEKQ